MLELLMNEILTAIVFSLVLVFTAFMLSRSISLKLNLGLVVLSRLFLNYVTRRIYFPDGFTFSYDENLMKTNVLFFINQFDAGNFALPQDRDGILVHVFLGIIAVVFDLSNYSEQTFMLIALQLNSIILVIALFIYLKTLELGKEKIVISLVTITFFDWFYFPTIDFRPEAFGITFFIILLNLHLQPHLKNSKWRKTTEIGLFLTHFLTFMFYSFFIIVIKILENNPKSKNLSGYELGTLIWLNIASNFVYPFLFLHRSFDFLSTFNNNPPLLNILAFGVILMTIYDFFWLIMLNPSIRFILYMRSMQIFKRIDHLNNLANPKRLLLALMIAGALMGAFFFLLLLETTGPSVGISFLLNFWKFSFAVLILYYYHWVMKEKNFEGLHPQYPYLLGSISSLVLFSFSALILIQNIHLRLFPELIIILFPGLISRFVDLELHTRPSIVVIFGLVMFFNILNGALILG